jgi:CTP:phosphocholine cytidylyltransferase-like protein
VQKPHEERKLPLKKWVGNNIQNLVAHAYKTADNDKWFWEEVKSTKYTQLQPMDFVLTLDSENGTWNKNRMSMIVWANGYRDQGICQLNRKYHIKFINSPEFQNEYKQVDYCWEVWKKGVLKNRLETTFYWYNTRDRNRKNFSF